MSKLSREAMRGWSQVMIVQERDVLEKGLTLAIPQPPLSRLGHDSFSLPCSHSPDDSHVPYQTYGMRRYLTCAI